MGQLSKLHSFPHRFDHRGVGLHHTPPRKARLPWEAWATLALGVAVGLAPWSFGFTGLGGATMNSVIIGMLVFALAGLTLTLQDRWEGWFTLGLGAWLVLAPWLLNFYRVPQAALPHLGFGLALMAVSILGLWRSWGEDEADSP